jgi:PKD repeat protein
VRILAIALAAAAALLLVASAPAAQRATPCPGTAVKVFDNTNGGGVTGGGKPPTFDTKGRSYCLTQVVTYHWNGGRGKTPGSVGLTGATMAATATARGSAGQGGAPNVNWTGTFVDPKPVYIDGSYECTDSDPATWSRNPQSGGKGFCAVYGVLQPGGSSGGPGGTKVGTQITTKVGAPAVSGGGATSKPKTTSKLSIKASPDAGKPPLAVTFALSAPKVVQWRVDFGDGLYRTGFGQPPASLVHSYAKAGDFRPRLTVLSAQGATPQSAATSVSAQAAPLISLTPAPASGAPPLAVTFKLSTTVQSVTSWAVDFGDGTKGGGQGPPPAAVYHTYRAAGAFRAEFAVKPGATALVYTVAQITVGGGAAPVLALAASPSSGRHPLTVKFTLTTSIPAELVSWEVVFGDGSRQTGQGAPPATVTHTYAKAGTYAAFLVVAQQQRYGGVQYTAPKGGLAISVG